MGDVTVDVVEGRKAVVRLTFLLITSCSYIVRCTGHIADACSSCMGHVTMWLLFAAHLVQAAKSRRSGKQGGAIAYAAAVANAYGTRACVVTAAGPDADLAVFKGHELHVVPTNSTLTFEHSYTWWGEDHISTDICTHQLLMLPSSFHFPYTCHTCGLTSNPVASGQP